MLLDRPERVNEGAPCEGRGGLCYRAPVRLAWFSPLPPDRSGIAAYSAELLPRLGRHAAIDVFLGRPAGPAPGGGLRLFSAHDFPRLHAASPYDLVVYQLGNARCHDYMWAYLVRYPGLVVLHDAQVHHARAAALMRRGRAEDYRAEFAFSHPDAPPAVAEFVVNGLQGSPYYLWPHRRVPLAAARAVAVHGGWLAKELAAEAGPTPVFPLRMGVRAHAPAGRAEVEGGPVFAAFGGITFEKRVPQVLRAFARTLERAPNARLVLAGEIRDHYDVAADAAALGIGTRLLLSGYVPDEALDAWIEAADVCLCLRWPTSRETSASWLRCLAAGKATVITDLAHTTEVPTLDPRDWQLRHTSTRGADADAPPGGDAAVAVAIDILDEDHSLGLAMGRLAGDAALRARLGDRARAWWAARHTLAHMEEDYLAAIAAARAQPAEPVGRATLPPHLLDEATATLSRITAELGIANPLAGEAGVRP